MDERITAEQALAALECFSIASGDREAWDAEALLRRFIEQAAEREAKEAHDRDCAEALANMGFGEP